MEDLDRPSWATEQTPCVEESERLTCVGVFQIKYQPSLNLNMVRQKAEIEANVLISKRIRQIISSNDTAYLDTNSNKTFISSFSNTQTKSTLERIKVTSRWYEVVEIREPEETTVIRYYVKVVIPYNFLK